MQNSRVRQYKGVKINESIADIDYDHIAMLAKRHNLSFDRLARNAEKGATTDADIMGGIGLVPPSDDWLTLTQSCILLGMMTGTFYCSVAVQGHYSGLRWKSRSKKLAAGKRGCGVLFHRAELEMLRTIKVEARISWIAAAKVNHAMFLGKF